MGDEVSIDKQLFHARLGNLLATWKDKKLNEPFQGVEALLVVLGKTQEGPYSKSLALQVGSSQFDRVMVLVSGGAERRWGKGYVVKG